MIRQVNLLTINLIKEIGGDKAIKLIEDILYNIFMLEQVAESLVKETEGASWQHIKRSSNPKSKEYDDGLSYIHWLNMARKYLTDGTNITPKYTAYGVINVNKEIP